MDPIHYRPQLTPSFVARSLQQKPPTITRAEVPFSCVTTDSRKIKPGCLFVALKGEKMDGHDFIESAISQGARGIICKRGFPVTPAKDLCIFSAEDPLAAFRRLAGFWRREFSVPVIAVAGSAGKTTTKELLASILKGKWPQILKTEKSQNGFIGIPMTLLELQADHQAAVIEVGIDEIGSMQQHINLVNPTTSVITAIGPEHLEKLIDVATVAREEGYALSMVAQNSGTVVINLDDPWIKPHAQILRGGRKILFSIQQGNLAETPSDSERIIGNLSPDGTLITYQGMGIQPQTLTLPLLGKHNASNLLAAISIALGLGLTPEEIKKGLNQFKGAEGRSEVYELPGSTRVLCDYYNAQPASVAAGLELLHQISHHPLSSKIRWACLADMLELGPDEQKFHRDLAPKIHELGIENVLLYGPRMKALYEELKSNGYKGNLAHFETQAQLTKELTEGLKPGDSVMIKGSRGMRMEEVWKQLELYAKSKWDNTHESKNHPPHP